MISDPRVAKFFLCLSCAIIMMIVLSGCDAGSEQMPVPIKVCTKVTGQYPCGRGGTCQECGSWEIGCPAPLELRQENTGTYGKGEPRLVCRMKETSNASAIPPKASPL